MAIVSEITISHKLIPGYPEPYYLVNGVMLASANPVHSLILQKLNLIKAKEKQLSALTRAALQAFLNELTEQTIIQENLKNTLHQLHLIYASEFTARKMRVKYDNILASKATERALGNEEDVASRLAAIYFKNFGITAEDIQQVVAQYISQTGKSMLDVKLNFAEEIANLYVDDSRYKLTTLLPDSASGVLFKSVIRGLQYNEDVEKTLKLVKQDVQICLSTYTSIWKLSIFGHHHNQRALAVKIAIENCQSLSDIRTLLLNQQNMLQGKSVELITPLLAERWACSEFLVNKKKNFASSGFYQSIHQALLALPLEKIVTDASNKQSLTFS